jgi:poly(A) polymerase
MRRRVEDYLRNGEQEFVAFQQAAQEIVREQGQVVSFPKRFSIPMREIWAMQSRLQRTGGRAPQRLMTHPRFRAAYDFLLLRAQAGEDLQPLCDFWTKLQENPEHERAPTTELEARGPRRRRRRRGGSRESTDPLPVSSADSSEDDDVADNVVDEFDEEGEE